MSSKLHPEHKRLLPDEIDKALRAEIAALQRELAEAKERINILEQQLITTLCQLITTQCQLIDRNSELFACRADLAAARAKLEECERDAERWRWLRQQGGWPDSEAGVSGFTPVQFDGMADAALTGETP